MRSRVQIPAPQPKTKGARRPFGSNTIFLPLLIVVLNKAALLSWFRLQSSCTISFVMFSIKHTTVHTASGSLATLLFFCFMGFSSALASQHYTAQQLQALASRIGNQYWISINDGREASFLTAPAEGAAPVDIEVNTSFKITDLVQGKNNDPYYKVQFDSGEEGYIRPEIFFEGLNLTFLSVDPHASEKRRKAEAAEQERKRIAWIQAQPWSQAIKEAAIDKQAVPGMRTHEIRKVMGPPIRTSRRLRGSQEEQWMYADGSVLIFHHGVLTQIEKRNP